MRRDVRAPAVMALPPASRAVVLATCTVAAAVLVLSLTELHADPETAGHAARSCTRRRLHRRAERVAADRAQQQPPVHHDGQLLDDPGCGAAAPA